MILTRVAAALGHGPEELIFDDDSRHPKW